MTAKKPKPQAEPGQSLEEFAGERDEARFKENQEIRRELNTVRAAYGTTKADLVRATSDLEALERIYDEALVLEPQPGWLSGGASDQENRATLVAFLSDLHAGEVTRPAEMGDYNAYNLAICDQRLERFFDRTLMLARDYLAGVTYDGIVLALGGDLVSGDIHDELEQTNELSVLDTTLWVAPRLLAGIERLAEEFGKVHVVSAPGNHGRDSQKPRYKGRSAHNADTHIARMVAMFYARANTSPAVTFEIPETIDAGFQVYDWRFSMEHGEEYQKNNPGTSEIGSLGPVKRGTLRKARQLEAEGKPFHYNLVAHFHQLVPAPLQGFVMNGSIKGYDQFARGLHLKPELAQQALLVCTPEHGLTTSMPVIVGDRDAEGW